LPLHHPPPFLSPNLIPRVFPVGFSLRRIFPHHENVYAAPSSLPSIFTALQEQLGLKLVSQKVPVDTLVIDHVDKIPTEN
jgi:hypothetical protein